MSFVNFLLLFLAIWYGSLFTYIGLRAWIIRKRKGLSRWRVGKRGMTKTRVPILEDFEEHYHK